MISVCRWNLSRRFHPVLSHTKSFGSRFAEVNSPKNHFSYTITNIKNKLTDLCRNWLLQNDFNNTWCEIRARCFMFRVPGKKHTIEYDPCIKNQLASRDWILDLMRCGLGHVIPQNLGWWRQTPDPPQSVGGGKIIWKRLQRRSPLLKTTALRGDWLLATPSRLLRGNNILWVWREPDRGFGASKWKGWCSRSFREPPLSRNHCLCFA